MIFTQTKLPGAFVIELETFADERGFFARSFCQREFAEHGLAETFVQCNISYNSRRGTLRGMHYQVAPHQEAKLVRCTAGEIYDVIVDLRPQSPTLYRWFGVRLGAASRRMLYVPEGFAHGFLTLLDDTEVFYQMSAFHSPEAARGARWNDPRFGIDWPELPLVMSQRDRSYEDFDRAAL